MDTNKLERKIEDGPSRDTLCDAFKYAKDKNGARVPVRFVIAAAYTGNPCDHNSAYIPYEIEDVRVNSITHEDGSGQSFVLEGTCRADLTYTGGKTKMTKPYKYWAYFHTRSRKGTIRFTPDGEFQ